MAARIDGGIMITRIGHGTTLYFCGVMAQSFRLAVFRSVVGDAWRFAEVKIIIDRLRRVGILCCRR